jgi:hypothetical protein
MNGKSSHILQTSSNLLGFAFLVLTSIKGFGLPQAGLIDEFVSLLIVLFALSTALSFVSIRSSSEEWSVRFETYADYAFLAGLFLTVLLSIFLASDVLLFALSPGHTV